MVVGVKGLPSLEVWEVLREEGRKEKWNCDLHDYEVSCQFSSLHIVAQLLVYIVDTNYTCIDLLLISICNSFSCMLILL